MRIPLDWLREYAPTDMGAEELARLITHRGVKVEGIIRPWAGLEGVVVVRVIEVRDHPDSEKLCLARIQHGSGETELVVGVRNMVAGDLVPWAPPGSRVPTLPEPLEARRIRGVESDGMLCSPRELAISQEHQGILVLDDTFQAGQDFKAKLGLGDAVLDIEVEPNRPDFLSILGVAREVAAATGVPLGSPDLNVIEAREPASQAATVQVQDLAGCPMYLARVIRGVSHRPSPLLAQARLTAAGMRPIDAVVDATNYTMLEMGQPLHGFDMERLAGPGIVVRRASEGELLTTLDDVERTLTAQDLLICDTEKPVAIAGIMGGETAEVSNETKDVLLESAYFTRGGVLLSARRLDLRTEASHRFERGTDPEGVERAAARCAKLISEWAGGEALAGAVSVGEPSQRRWISLRPARASALLGYAVSERDAVEVFDALGMGHRAEGDRIEVEVPGYRTDIDREVDLIEEVVRVQGYDRVGSTLPRAPHAGGLPEDYAFALRAKRSLVAAGLREVRPAPFSPAEDLEMFGDQNAVQIANPLRAEEGYMRTRLTPGLLRTVARNQDLGVERVAIFEVGNTFRLADPFEQARKAGFALCGPAETGWAAQGRELDVLDAKGVLEALMRDLGVEDWGLGEAPPGPFHPGRAAQVFIGGEPGGVLGEIHPRAAAALGISGRVAVGVVGLRAAAAAAAAADGRALTVRDVPRFPPVRRDLAFVVPEDAPAGEVQGSLERAGGELLTRCVLFDVFRGGALPEGRKSLAFAVEFRAQDRTLTDEEAQDGVDRVVAALGAEFDAELRSG